MTSAVMLREFKVGMDKIDSQSYPEIYDEQIYMFINKAINELVTEGRKIFETTQTITDNLKSLIPERPVILTATLVPNTDEYTFNLLANNINYLFYIRSSIKTQVGTKTGKAEAVTTQQDDIESFLYDPYNKPKPYRVLITFSRNTVTAYSDGTFSIINMSLVYVKQPALVSVTVNCDLDTQIHYSIVNRAIQLAEISLGLINNNNNTQQTQ